MRAEVPAAWRSLPWRPLVIGSAVGVTLLLLTAAWPRSPLLPLGVWGALAALAVAAAPLLDEVCAEVVRATPVPVRRRHGQRLLAGLLPWGGGLAGLAMVDARAAAFSWSVTALELTGVLLATAAASAALLSRNPAPGARVGEAVGPLLLAVALAQPVSRWVDPLPVQAPADSGRTLALWTTVTALSLIGLTRAMRERKG